MNKLKNNSSFLGKGWSFPPVFDKFSMNVGMVSDQTDIEQSLKILFSTNKGERTMLPEYGCSLVEYLFEEADSSLFSIIKDRIQNAILYYEPRITVNGIIVSEDQLNNADNYTKGVLLIHIDYTVKATNSRNNMVYPFYLNEGNLLNRPEIF